MVDNYCIVNWAVIAVNTSQVPQDRTLFTQKGS